MSAQASPTHPQIADTAPSPSPAWIRWTQWHALTDTLTPLLTDPKQSADFHGEIGQATRSLMDLTAQSPDMALFFLFHERADPLARYSVLHAMHTAILMTLIGRRKDWGGVRTACGVSASLTMNLSAMGLQDVLARQIEPLSAEQQAHMQAHPLESWQLLQDLGVSDPVWLEAVAQHHEQADGLGYPKGLRALHPLADAIRTCDVFGAKVSSRASRSSMPTPHAAADIFRQRSAGYIGASIIGEVGLYPPGSVVALASGEQAVVVARTSKPEQPQAVVIRDAAGQPVQALTRCITAVASSRRILGVARDQAWIDLIKPEALIDCM